MPPPASYVKLPSARGYIDLCTMQRKCISLFKMENDQGGGDSGGTQRSCMKYRTD